MTDKIQTRNYTRRERERRDANKKETKIFELSFFFLCFHVAKDIFLISKESFLWGWQDDSMDKVLPQRLTSWVWSQVAEREQTPESLLSSDLHMHTELGMATYWISVLTAALGTNGFGMSPETCGPFSAPLRSSSQNKECPGPEVYIHPKHTPPPHLSKFDVPGCGRELAI